MPAASGLVGGLLKRKETSGSEKLLPACSLLASLCVVSYSPCDCSSCAPSPPAAGLLKLPLLPPRHLLSPRGLCCTLTPAACTQSLGPTPSCLPAPPPPGNLRVQRRAPCSPAAALHVVPRGLQAGHLLPPPASQGPQHRAGLGNSCQWPDWLSRKLLPASWADPVPPEQCACHSRPPFP